MRRTDAANTAHANHQPYLHDNHAFHEARNFASRTNRFVGRNVEVERRRRGQAECISTPVKCG